MPTPFMATRPPNPFFRNQKNKRNTQQSETDLRYYPLLRGRQAVSEMQASIAANQRSALNAELLSEQTENPPFSASGAETRPQEWQRQASQQMQTPPMQRSPIQRSPMQRPQTPYPQGPMPPVQPRPPAFAQAPPMNAPAQPNAPMNDAVSQFKRANQNLPDGVRYEPIDEKTLQMLRAADKAPPSAPPAPSAISQPSAAPQHAAAPSPSSVRPPSDAPSHEQRALSDTENEHAEALERLMQDERNAYTFYTHLSKQSPRTDFKTVLGNIAESCSRRVEVYGGLLEGLFERAYTPTETAVNTRVSFEDGVALAVREENKILRTLAEMQEAASDKRTAETIQHIINRKLVDHNMLHFMVTDMQGAAKL